MISDKQIINGVKIEVNRTIPFWRCFQDLQIKYKHKPVLERIRVHLQCRQPCNFFTGVDVVWAISHVGLRVQTGLADTQHQRVRRPVRTDAIATDAGVKRCRSSVSTKPEGVKSWRGVPSELVTVKLGTMHFVHADAYHPLNPGHQNSFHIQSVYFYDRPEVMQCVAGVMVHFAQVVHASIRMGTELAIQKKSVDSLIQTLAEEERQAEHAGASPPETLQRFLFGPNSRVLVLGMGGNTIAVALRRMLGALVRIDVVEIEPAVVEACRKAGTLMETDPQHRVYQEDAKLFLQRQCAEKLEKPVEGYDLIFMDLFEPMEAQMEVGPSVVNHCYHLLNPRGLLVVNDHHLPDPKRLVPFTALFGNGLVHAINIHGWKESVIVAITESAKEESDELKNNSTPPLMDVSLKACIRMATALYVGYEHFLPGVFPDPRNWLRSMRTYGKTPHCCRIWAS